MSLLLAAALMTPAWLNPTKNGDPIGTARMSIAGDLELRLRSVQCDGTLAETMYRYKPADPDYRSTLAWVGTIRRGETKTLRARDLAPCLRRPH